MGIPYVNYKLEYPPVIGVDHMDWAGDRNLSTTRPRPVQCTTWSLNLPAIPFHDRHHYNIYLLCEKLQIDRKRIYLYLLSTLTFIIYGFYNWDFIVAYFVSLSILFSLKKDTTQARSPSAGGILSKFIPICMAPRWLSRYQITELGLDSSQSL